MAIINRLQRYGNHMKILFDDGSSILSYPVSVDMYFVPDNPVGVASIRVYGNQIAIIYEDGYTIFGYPVASDLWYVKNVDYSTGGGDGADWEWPLNTSLWFISSPFGPRTLPYVGFHRGIDIAGAGINGTDVWAITNSVCTNKGFGGSGGNYIQIDHNIDGTRSLYLHLIAPSSISIGDPVTKGQVIGNVGATGDATGPHLHFEVHNPVTSAVDPIPFMAARGRTFGEVQLS